MTKTLWQSPTIALLTAAVMVCGTAAYAQTQQTKPAQKKPAVEAQKKPPKAEPTEQAVLLGQFGGWGAYTATPGGKTACFTLAKPTSAVTEPAGRNRDPSYRFFPPPPPER